MQAREGGHLLDFVLQGAITGVPPQLGVQLPLRAGSLRSSSTLPFSVRGVPCVLWALLPVAVN